MMLSTPTATKGSFGSFEVTGSAVNLTMTSLRDLTVTFTLYDAEGSVVGYATDRLPVLEPSQKWRYRASAMSRDATHFQFKHLTVDAMGTAAVKVQFTR